MEYSEIPTLETQDPFLKRHSSSAASVVGECQVSPVAATEANDHGDVNVNWNMEGAFELCHIKRVGTKRPLRNFQDCCRTTNASLSEPLLRCSG